MATNSGTSSQPVTPSNASVQEFKIRVPKNVKKKHHVMRFNATLNVDFAKWSQVKMERENNMKEFKGLEEDQPKFGAGSEYGRDAREEARRKKFGIVARKYKPEDQPWILKVGGKTGKKFKGIREGGVSENAAYYVFTHAADGAIEAYPLQEWYNFQPIQRYKSLSAEEAEQEFGRRNKVMNYFSLMLRKRLRGDEIDGEADDPDDKKVKGPKAKELKISDMDEWMDSSEDSSNSEAEKEKDADSDSNAKKKSKKAEAVKKKKKKRDVDDEAFEESDDGDEEGRERDYISDSSESESDHEGKANKELKGVAEEDALRKLLTSDEDSEEEKSDKVESEPEDAEKDKEAEERSKKLKKKKKEDGKKGNKDSSSDFSSDSDSEPDAAKKKKKSSKEGGVRQGAREEGSVSAGSSRSATPTPAAPGATPGAAPPPAKRAKIEAANESGVTEEAVRRYLMRKPMTTTELLTKFKSKKSGVSSDRLVETMTQILKRINPVKQMIKGKMYLSIKA